MKYVALSLLAGLLVASAVTNLALSVRLDESRRQYQDAVYGWATCLQAQSPPDEYPECDPVTPRGVSL
jgi:hypothetical protein